MLKTLILLLLLAVGGTLFLRLYPPFGGPISEDTKLRMQESPQYQDGKFVNELPTSIAMDGIETVKYLGERLRGRPNLNPQEPLPMQKMDLNNWEQSKGISITWVGHSSALLRWNEKTILIDPVFGKFPSPFPVFSGNRYSQELPFDVDQLPAIDAVIYSHDHYDHLDYGTLQQIKGKVKQFFVPLGVSSHLKRWGVDEAKIHEFDWWDEFTWEGLRIASTPARHFSGRSLTDRNRTLWSSWVIATADGTGRLFYSGDSGYGPHFSAIGEKYGPFDLALMECGQYDVRWQEVHMTPEETVKAAKDVRTARFMPVHWAAFTLAMHDWDDPIKRVIAEADRLDIPIVTPQLGESVELTTGNWPVAKWWE